MNSRERLMLALNHKEPDRVPIDFSATTVSGICWLAYDELLETIGLKRTGRSIFDLGGAAIMGFAFPAWFNILGLLVGYAVVAGPFDRK